MKTLIQLPEIPVGSIFNPERGFFSIVVPLERTNLILNPILKNNATGWSDALNATFTSGFLVTANYYHGYGAAVEPNVSNAQYGIFYTTSTLTSGVTYVASVKFKQLRVRGNPTYAIAVATTGGVDLAVYRFKATGRWQWVWVFWTETSSTTRRIYIRRDDTGARGLDLGAPVDEFVISGLQLESCADGVLAPTTYIDGDQQGLLTNQFPPPYRWNGTPHASTSTRLITTAAGGYLMNFDRFFYKVLAFTGLGLTAVANIASTGAGTDGATYQTTVAQQRQFAINGFVDARSPQELDYRRSQLYRALGPDGANPRQPRVLVYEPYDGYDAIGAFGQIIASYQSGLEGVTNGTPRETAPITFTQWLPAILTGRAGVGLSVQTSVSNANAILQRAADGTWAAMGTGASTGASRQVRALAVGLDGAIYAGGDFDTMGGVANTSKIAKWTPSTGAWTALGTGITGTSVFALAVAPNGDLYVGGSFTDAGGSGADNIAVWNGSTWAVVGSATAINSEVDALAIDTDGIVYAGGAFTNAGGVAAADFIAKWDGSAWTALGTALNNGVSALAVGLDGRTIYLGGTFTDAGGVANADRVAYWDGSAYNAMSTGANSQVMALAVGRDGRVYAGGSFTTIGGVAATYIAVWNGSGWTQLGAGINNTVRAIVVGADAIVYAGGDFTVANGITLPDRFALWNGSAWVAADVDLPGSPQVSALVLAPTTGTLVVGYSTTGTATAAGVTPTTTNVSTARAYPSIVIVGPSSGTARIFRISNGTTGRLIYLNLTMNPGETVTIRTSPAGTRASSTMRGDISNVILPGSSPDFFLAPGVNTIAFFSTSSTIGADMLWTTALQSASDLIE